jgi:nitrate reductase NapE component
MPPQKQTPSDELRAFGLSLAALVVAVVFAFIVSVAVITAFGLT